MKRHLWVFLAIGCFACQALPCLAESVVDVEFCELVRDPGLYDHKLIKITGNASHGFEDFTLSSESCGKRPTYVWLEIGGKIGSRTTYCCGQTYEETRKKALIVQGFETTVINDVAFAKFMDVVIKEDSQAKVTVIGRFFAGNKSTNPNGTFWSGFGHMGAYSLLVIQQVVSVVSPSSK
ncbi:hypothetical protein [Geothrix limicola]|uniref:hypothetical protein n=1 Tax=Geothrix limicola TaxID=2927978 RepID=UPI00255481B2|nr:hypothetical protein [Geothrix limicola]